jgi:hypothetical protein
MPALAEVTIKRESEIPPDALAAGPVVLVVQYVVPGRPITRTYIERDWHACHADARLVRGADHVVCVSAEAWEAAGEAMPTAQFAEGAI